MLYWFLEMFAVSGKEAILISEKTYSDLLATIKNAKVTSESLAELHFLLELSDGELSVWETMELERLIANKFQSLT